MATEAKFKFLVLWASELRAADAAIEDATRILKDKTVPEKEVGIAIMRAFQVCRTALLGCSGVDHMVVCEAERAKFEPRVTNVEPRPAKPAGGKDAK